MQCPGQDTRYWKPGAIFEIPCPRCKQPVEFFKDESTRKCPHCGHKAVNPQMDFGCAAYCRHAAQCLGDLPPELVARRGDLLKERVAIAMKRHFGRDFRRIGHATRVARHAERIAREEGGEMVVVLAAALLLDVGAPGSADPSLGSGAARRATGGPEVARAILAGLGAGPDVTEEVLSIIADRRDPPHDASLNLRIVRDAETVAEIEEAAGSPDDATPAAADQRTFLTAAGRRLADEQHRQMPIQHHTRRNES